MHRRPLQRGFTLLEMLIAMSLMAMLAASLYASLRIAFNGRTAADRNLEPVRRAAAAMEMLRADLEAAVVPSGLLAAGFLGETADDGGDAVDALLFHARARDQSGYVPPSPILQIQVGMAQDEGTGERVLLRRTTANLLAPEEEDPLDEVLCRRVRAFDTAFYDGTAWSESWDSTAQDNVLPLAVEVSILLDVQDREDGYLLKRVISLPCGSLAEEESSGGGGGAGGAAGGAAGGGGGDGGFGGGGR